MDLIRARLRECGYDERVRLEAGAGFEWEALQQQADTLSLFAQKRIFDLRLPTGKPGDKGAKALTRYAERPSADNVLIVSAPKLDASARASRWYKALEGVGLCIQIWPIEPRQLPAWVRKRAAGAGLELDREAAALLAERTEGNLLACAQELRKLALLATSKKIDADAIMSGVADSARFNVFDLIASALEGNRARTVRIMDGLREEGVEPVLVAWALGRELRTLERLASNRDRGGSLQQLMNRERMWQKRKDQIATALNRLSSDSLRRLVKLLAHVDRVIKGAAKGNPWDELLRLGLGLAGVMILPDIGV